jgi:hypothetical protein
MLRLLRWDGRRLEPTEGVGRATMSAIDPKQTFGAYG